MLGIRLMTACVLVGVVVFGLSFSPSSVMTNALFFLFATMAGAEFAALRWHTLVGDVSVESPRPNLMPLHGVMGAFYGGCIPIWLLGNEYFAAGNGGMVLVLAWVSVGLLGMACGLYVRTGEISMQISQLMNGLAGVAYVAFPILVMSWLARLEVGPVPAYALYFTLAVVFMGDTGAYFIGRLLGKHKLAPRVSPKKTVEGSLGGLVFSSGVSFLLCHFFPIGLNAVAALLVGLGVGVAGQIGDLIESAVKRAANCKDSSHLLPGHGGVLDRIDSLLFSAPLCYCVIFLAQASL